MDAVKELVFRMWINVSKYAMRYARIQNVELLLLHVAPFLKIRGQAYRKS